MCPGPRLITVEAWIEFLESDQHKHTINSHTFSQSRDQNDTLDFRENEKQMDREKVNIQKVGQVR